ncbi:MAG: glycoside hydrolase family 2, partial [Clostridia bacterium]|nr:glycoside hydrolase family 2 [Clostridia bacterium]
IRFTPDIDKSTITVELDYNEKKEGFMFYIKTEIGELRVSSPGPKLTLDLTGMLRLWSPEEPFLYHAKVVTVSGDSFDTYFAMRKISVGKVGKFTRIMLNNKPYFQKGLLDQGYWCDGLYTAPSDEAMIYDIKTMKDMGFNMLRKHIKIEPLRWYYHCDRLGMLVWQDVVSGGVIADNGIRREYPGYEKLTGKKKIKKIPSDTEKNYTLLGRENPSGRKEYNRDLVDTVQLLYNNPCVIMWVPFNESWGQFDSAKATETVLSMDQTRLVDSASGWFDQGCGSVNSLHNYRKKPWYPRYGGNKDKRALVLSECGGLTYSPGAEHVFDTLKRCGYRGFKDADSCTKALVALQKRLGKAIKKNGLCAYVYTQVSDVEEELNGLLSYDRKVVKVDANKIKEANDKLIIE